MAMGREWRKLGILLIAGAIAGCPDRPLDEVRRLRAAGKSKEAATLAVRLVKLDPANLPAWDAAVEIWCTELVHVGECLNVLDLELEKLGNVQRHKDALAEVLERRARSRLESGMAQSALMDLDRAHKASPKRATTFVIRARAYATMGDRGRAVAALDTARKLNPSHPELADVAKLVPEAPPDDEPFGGD